MHEPFDPACSHCRYFAYCFPAQSPLADWGYCSLTWPDGGPSPHHLDELQRSAESGDYHRLYALAQGIFQETDDGCTAYQPR